MKSLVSEPATRQKRLAEIPGLVSSAEKTLRGVEEQLALPNPTTETPIETRARLARTNAYKAALEAEVAELQVQVSVGCYVAIATAEMVSTDYIHAADQALYQAKTAGRNQIKLYPSPPTEAESTVAEGNPDELKL